MKSVLLFSYPTGDISNLAAKWHIWEMLREKLPELTHSECEDGFEVLNLLDTEHDTLPSLYEGRTIVVIGETGREALGLPKILLHPFMFRGVEWRQLPHPIGGYQWYSDRSCRDLAVLLLHELYLRGNPNGKTV